MGIRIGTKETIKSLEHWFSLDIGFSETTRSCGIYTSAEDCSGYDVKYGKVVEEINKFLKDNDKKEIGLIIEAPLSIYFSHEGNPLGRKNIEKIEKDNKTLTRYWYNGAGATVTLATLNLLNELNELDALKKLDKTIYVFEGMVSFKNQGTEHFKDAKMLYDAIVSPNKDNFIIYNQDDIFHDKEGNHKFLGNYLNLDLKGIPPIIRINPNSNQ